ncbi:MAG: HTTM domain-containing protein [Flavobacteriaceae bacterium]|nr:HTTM domain-containing protein [Flavobacteriaceae bacterium]
MLKSVRTYLNTPTEAAPLAVFRIFFGVMMCFSLLRFWYNGWIEKLYIEPAFHFNYYGFEWVRAWGEYTYLLFIICFIASLGVALGYRYRLSIVVFFLSFTYIELIDKTTYLNHYYFISCLSFLMMFLPAHHYFSLDAKLERIKASFYVQNWTIVAIKVFISIVYIYAGLAKLNSDWLIEAMPLKIWLPSKYDLPLLGDLMQQSWVHYAFSWTGMIYDLSIPILLWIPRTRWFAFIWVVIFHVLTRVLFPIGMFPFIMITSALIFFEAKFHHQILSLLSRIFNISKHKWDQRLKTVHIPQLSFLQKYVVLLFIGFQLLFPWRYLAYPGELFWTEEGYRFSWRVMLMEKAGYAQFKVRDGVTGKEFLVDNTDFLTPLQEKQMSFQPDFIIEYAHYLGEHFEKQGHQNVEVFVESYVALNGRLSQPYIDPTINLMKVDDSFSPKEYILPFNDTIKGL